MLKLPSPDREYTTDWANQYTRRLEQDSTKVWSALQEVQSQGTTPLLAFTSEDVNFNSANTDTAISIVLPAPNSRYLVSSVRISAASQTLTTATVGLFTAAAGAGVAIVTGASAVTVATASENTNNNAQALTVNNANTQSYNVTTLYFRIATPQGAAATANVTIAIQLLL